MESFIHISLKLPFISLSIMEFSMKSFAVVSFLLLVSLSTDMSGPLVVDAQICVPGLCKLYCSSQGLPWCCPGLGWSPCRCTFACPFADSVTKKITEEAMAGATDKEPFIKEIVIA